MIQNEKQYKITKKLLSEVVAKIKQLKSDKEQDPLSIQLILATTENFRKDLEKQIKDYEKLKFAKTSVLKERSLSDLPSIIIEYKIAHNLTHKEFAKLLGLKEQQLQRYEAEGFKTVSFQNLMKFINIINLDLKVKEIIIKPKRKLRTASGKELSKA